MSLRVNLPFSNICVKYNNDIKTRDTDLGFGTERKTGCHCVSSEIIHKTSVYLFRIKFIYLNQNVQRFFFPINQMQTIMSTSHLVSFSSFELFFYIHMF